MASSEAMAADSSPLASIFSKSLKLLSTNTKPILPIFLLSLIPCSLMLFPSSGPINPLILESLTMPYPANTSVVDYFRHGFDPRSYDIKALSSITICHFLFFVPIVAGIRSLFQICAGEQLSPRESVMAIAKSLSMASFLTRLCVTVLDLANKYLIVALNAQNLGGVLILIYMVSLLFGSYVLPVFSVLALVVAAVEGRCGVSALRRAVELVGRLGRRLLQAPALAAVFVVIHSAFYQVLNLALSYVDGRAGPVVWAATRVVQVAGVAALGMWTLAAYVMFYCEVRKRCEEEKIAAVDEAREKGADEYSALAGDQDLP